ncbi:hypothetical protein CH289_16040 [Rhodococcus sp. RS1C4]|nr:hypothetical protein [Rhodococcus sp. RS1C4]OZC50535.1 hypothetical protein CH289_16040 [Rhodococcus sp. RS1C4]
MTYNEHFRPDPAGLQIPYDQLGRFVLPTYSPLDAEEMADVVTAWLRIRGPRNNRPYVPPTRRERIRRRIRRIRNTPRRYHERLTIAVHALRGDLDGWTPDE